MAKRHFHPAAEIAEDEWEKIEAAFATSALIAIVKKMRELHNAPQKAGELFPRHQENYGHELLNTFLRKEGLSFRFTRTEPQKKEHRSDRMLAFVRWETAESVS